MGVALRQLTSRTHVGDGTIADCSDADELVFCAAAPVRLGQTRNEMFAKNLAIVESVVPSIEAAGFKGLYVMVSNPVDLLTYALTDRLGIPARRVAGTGCVLDSMRLADALAGTHDARAHALCLGEHGENLIVDWSHTSVGGVSLGVADRETYRHRTIETAYDIMKGKGSTSYGIAQAVAQIIATRSLNPPEAQPLPLSLTLDGAYGIEGIALSVPAVFGSDGWPQVAGLELDDDVLESLQAAALQMRAVYQEAIPE
jgi:L-lactate dehydrogenase